VTWLQSPQNFGYIGRECACRNKNSEALVVAGKEIGLEVNADKTKYMVMSGDQSTSRSHTIKTDNSSLNGKNSSNI